MKHRFFYVFLSAVLIFSIASGCSPASPADAAADDAAANAIEVQIAYPSRMDLERSTEFVGRVESGISVSVYSEVPAKILNTYKNSGEYVFEGELLMEVDDTDMRTALAGAQSALAAAQLGYQQAQTTQAISTSGSGYQTKQLSNSKSLSDLLDKYYETLRSGRQLNDTLDSYTAALWDATSSKNKAQAAFASVEAETVSKVAIWANNPVLAGVGSDGLINYIKKTSSPEISLIISSALKSDTSLSQEVYDQQIKYTNAAGAVSATATAEKTAQSALDAYEKQYDTSASTIDSSIRSITKNYDYYAQTYSIADGLGTAETQALNGISLATLKLSCDNAQRSVDTAQRNLEKCKVYAPVSGTITSKNAVASNYASAAASMYVIAADDTAPVISFSVSEDGANALSIGSPLTVIANGQSYEAQLTEIANSTSAGSGLYAAKASLPVNAGLERTGMVVKVRAATAQAKNVLTLPLDYVQYDGDQPYVLAYQDGTAVRCDLTLGMSTRSEVEVIDGITASDAIITTWHPELRNGSIVRCDALQASGTEVKAPDFTSPADTIEVIE